MHDLSIVGLILTYNEELNIRGCIESMHFCDEIIVFDSFSTDCTVEIAESCGAKVEKRYFDNYAAQRNAAFKSVSKDYTWVLMLDADERVSSGLEEEIKRIIAKESVATLFRVRRKDHFMGKWLKYSSGYPTWFPRLFRNGEVMVSREINEEYNTTGEVHDLQAHLLHFPFNKGLSWWFERHNRYSLMEANVLEEEFNQAIPWRLIFSNDSVDRRKFQKQFVYRLPGRPLIIFFGFYFLRRGFLDGKAGLRFCIMRMVYEIMIDLKIKEIKWKKSQ